ncbi:MAG: gamma-glutamylcyclotransferase [Rubrobacter sp.]|nr:gamma-glutamylcyclotransferase [Rubrobacter sp.]
MTLEKPALLDVFVYGTLKRGQRNHERFCRGVLAVREATVRGRLYDLPFGFPALVVPKEDVWATGTADYRADVEAQNHARTGTPVTSPNQDVVHGELMSFDDSEERLPALDGLEGFRPGGKSFYGRVLVPATLAETGAIVPVWIYVVESASGVYLPGGCWPP